MKKTALVTGASSGIGEATAKLLAENGYTVYGAARRTEKMEQLKRSGVHVHNISAITLLRYENQTFAFG